MVTAVFGGVGARQAAVLSQSVGPACPEHGWECCRGAGSAWPCAVQLLCRHRPGLRAAKRGRGTLGCIAKSVAAGDGAGKLMLVQGDDAAWEQGLRGVSARGELFQAVSLGRRAGSSSGEMGGILVCVQEEHCWRDLLDSGVGVSKGCREMNVWETSRNCRNESKVRKGS